MEEKKYELSLSDIKMFIGLGASAVCDEHGIDDKESSIVVIVAADICEKIHAHLTGECEFTKEEIDIYNAVIDLTNEQIKQEEKRARERMLKRVLGIEE